VQEYIPIILIFHILITVFYCSLIPPGKENAGEMIDSEITIY
jgi:hypothetical protein